MNGLTNRIAVGVRQDHPEQHPAHQVPPIKQVNLGQPIIPAVNQEAIVVNRNILGEVSHQEHEDERLIREQRQSRLSACQYRQPTLNGACTLLCI
jgi:hypothetical protein